VLVTLNNQFALNETGSYMDMYADIAHVKSLFKTYPVFTYGFEDPDISFTESFNPGLGMTNFHLEGCCEHYDLFEMPLVKGFFVYTH
jgi:hypothetical protein